MDLGRFAFATFVFAHKGLANRIAVLTEHDEVRVVDSVTLMQMRGDDFKASFWLEDAVGLDLLEIGKRVGAWN